MKRKRYFTLIELVISLGLTAILLSALLFSYSSIISASAAIEAVEREAFSARYLQMRLLKLFLKAEKPNNKNAFFFTPGVPSLSFKDKTDNLILSYDNGIVAVPLFSNETMGRLYVDPKGNLTLMTWPDRKEWPESGPVPFHKETLMEGVDQFKLEFYAVPDPKDPQSTVGWQNIWAKSENKLPGFVRVSLKKAQDKNFQIFVFPIQKGIPPVRYPA